MVGRLRLSIRSQLYGSSIVTCLMLVVLVGIAAWQLRRLSLETKQLSSETKVVMTLSTSIEKAAAVMALPSNAAEGRGATLETYAVRRDDLVKELTELVSVGSEQQQKGLTAALDALKRADVEAKNVFAHLAGGRKDDAQIQALVLEELSSEFLGGLRKVSIDARQALNGHLASVEGRVDAPLRSLIATSLVVVLLSIVISVLIVRSVFFWDGRASTLEEQALAPIRNAEEMGLPGDTAAAKLRAIPSYAATFSEVYPKSGVTMANIAKALAAFERTLVSKDSPVDRYAAGDTRALSESAVRGRTLFFGRASCSTCHSGPNFTDGLFHNTGVMGEDVGRAAFDRVGEFQMRPYPFFQMRRAFKTPGLRNVALTAPYQHDGSEASLEEVVSFYNKGGRDPQSYGKALDIRPLNLTDGDVKDIVAFLEGLTAPVEVLIRSTPN